MNRLLRNRCQIEPVNEGSAKFTGVEPEPVYHTAGQEPGIELAKCHCVLESNLFILIHFQLALFINIYRYVEENKKLF